MSGLETRNSFGMVLRHSPPLDYTKLVEAPKITRFRTVDESGSLLPLSIPIY